MDKEKLCKIYKIVSWIAIFSIFIITMVLVCFEIPRPYEKILLAINALLVLIVGIIRLVNKPFVKDSTLFIP